MTSIEASRPGQRPDRAQSADELDNYLFDLRGYLILRGVADD